MKLLPMYVVCSIPLLPRSSYTHIFASAPYFPTPLNLSFPSMSEAKFRTHKNDRQNYISFDSTLLVISDRVYELASADCDSQATHYL